MTSRAPRRAVHGIGAARHVRGLSLMFALIALVVLSLAAVALVRSVDTGALVIGNLGFKQDATASSDQAAEQAIEWLSGNISGVALDNNMPAQGYSAVSVDQLDPTGNNASLTSRAVIDWKGDGCSSYPSGTYGGGCLQPAVGTDVNGNKTQYFITRLCPATGPANFGGNDCSAPLVGDAQSSGRGKFDYRKYERFAPSGGGGAYFRVVVRTTGGKNAVSFTETVVHF
jgi:hypothetical protein